MHEMSLCESLVRILEEQAAAHAFSRVKTVWLEIGPRATVDAQALQFCFDAVTRGTIAESARLDICTTAAKAWCFSCEEAISIDDRHSVCPICGSNHVQVTGGDELRIKELEVD